MKQKNAVERIYRCNVCGSVAARLYDGAGGFVCCGEPMELLEEKTADSKTEKHVPVVTALISGGVKVVVGSTLHPMTEEHHIVFIEVQNGRYVNRKYLSPGDPPEAEFYMPYSDKLIVREYCNVHGLWKK